MRSNLRWCSDCLEFTCWNGEVVRLAFIIDASTERSFPGRRSPMPEYPARMAASTQKI